MMSFFMAILALGILILVHELGHFIAAKISGVYVEKFSIGFGPKIVSFTKGETEYRISAIPLGGYVKLHRMFKEEDVVEGKEHQAFYNKPYFKKVFIISAGVLFNLIFAILVLTAVSMIGYKSFSPVVGNIQAGGAGDLAGFKRWDKILSVNNNPIRSWQEFDIAVNESARKHVGKPLTVAISRDNTTMNITMVPVLTEDKNSFGEKSMLFDYGMIMAISPISGDIIKGYPAEKAGFKYGDRFLAVNGDEITDWSEVSKYTQSNPNKEIVITISRNGKVIDIPITPSPVERDGVIKGMVGLHPFDGDVIVRDNFFVAFSNSVAGTVKLTKLIYREIGKMIMGKVSKKDIGGPILIVQQGSESAKSGYERYLTFIAMLSINLAILNMLPLPILDGGYVVMYTYEAITRRQVSVRAREVLMKIGLSLLVMLMFFAFYNDITRFFKF